MKTNFTHLVQLIALAAPSHEFPQISFEFSRVDGVFVAAEVFDFLNIAWLPRVGKVWNIKELS